MDTENDEDVRAAWQTQSTEILTLEEIRKSVEEMEKRMRRQRIDFVLALVGSSIVIVGIAILFAQTVLLAGAAATLAGFAFLAWEVTQHGRRKPVAENGATVSLEYKKVMLPHPPAPSRHTTCVRWCVCVPVAENGATVSLEYKRALLQHRLDFHRKRLWLRVLALAPGGVLFFLGFAAARPDLAVMIYFELATFIVAIALIVPLNRKAASRLERQIVEIDRLR